MGNHRLQSPLGLRALNPSLLTDPVLMKPRNVGACRPPPEWWSIVNPGDNVATIHRSHQRFLIRIEHSHLTPNWRTHFPPHLE